MVDGFHIQTLWITFFYRYRKEYIENGRLFLGCPPLYKNTIGKEIKYTYTENEQDKFIKTNKPNAIQRYKGLGEMNADQLWDTTLNPDTRVLYQVAIEDAVECDKVISMLMGDNVPIRKEFIKSYKGDE